MDINVVHRYSYLAEKLLLIDYYALGVKLTVTLQECNGCAKFKAKSCVVRKNTYTRVSQLGESIFMENTSSFLDILIGNRYGIVVVGYYISYYWILLTKPSHNYRRRWRSS